MTDRIYYTDPARLAFDATVQRTVDHDGHPAVVLDRTAFYPTSGGQPFDTGRLGDADVVDVIDLEDGDVLHVLSSPLAVGAAVHGEVHGARRRDHMQQHTGQHILSAAFDRLFDARTVSFHLGATDATIDVSREMSPAQIAAAEVDANRIVWDDRPVGVRFVSQAEAAVLPLRKEPAREGTLRLVDIDGFDLSACGGTHVPRTGGVGLIGVTGWERFKGGSRVTFVCGGRALAALRGYRDAVAGSIRLLSVLPQDLPSAIERLQAEGKETSRALTRAQETLAGIEGRRLADAAGVVANDGAPRGVRVIVEALDGWDANGLKAVATAATAGTGTVAALFSTSTPPVAALARSKDVAVDTQAIFKALVARFGGRGGGKPELVQGGGFSASPADLVAAARALIESHH